MSKKSSVYVPDGPYVYKSGRREDQAAEVLMFKEYGFLSWHYQKIREERARDSSPGDYEKHLEWLLNQGETREPKLTCPQCNEKTIKYFGVRLARHDFSIGARYTTCDSKGCIDQLRSFSPGNRIELYEPQFSNIKEIAENKQDEKRLGQLYRKLFNLPVPPKEQLTRKIAFRFFQS